MFKTIAIVDAVGKILAHGVTQIRLGEVMCAYRHTDTLVVEGDVVAGERMTRDELAGMGHGGLCLNCPDCQFPRCPFGKRFFFFPAEEIKKTISLR